MGVKVIDSVSCIEFSKWKFEIGFATSLPALNLDFCIRSKARSVGRDFYSCVDVTQGTKIRGMPEMFWAALKDWDKMMSNDAYRSVEHRVLANNAEGARVSFAVFFEPSNREGLYGPFPELITAEKPAIYHEFIFEDFFRRFLSKEVDGKSKLDYYRIDNTNKA
ncbi:oxoglutarate/iron-dependent dioxygenase [Tanacetum coccineum]|uniref:Oxoglutarate/iron-dependent dioxygenase n=1 Tax=Tanacetum coccineum TaxID=301880 RepID=A0ABQ5F279_9ASTR